MDFSQEILKGKWIIIPLPTMFWGLHIFIHERVECVNDVYKIGPIMSNSPGGKQHRGKLLAQGILSQYMKSTHFSWDTKKITSGLSLITWHMSVKPL